MHARLSHTGKADMSLAMVERTLDALGGGCFAATLWPWDVPVPDPATESAAEVLAFFDSQQANEDHWGKIGFKRIPGTAILIRDLNAYGWRVESLLEGDYRRLAPSDADDDGDDVPL